MKKITFFRKKPLKNFVDLKKYFKFASSIKGISPELTKQLLRKQK